MKKSIIVDSLNEGSRIDKWLKRVFVKLNQSFIEKNLRKGFIKVDNKKVKSSYKIKKNDVVNIYNFSIEKYPSKIKTIYKKKISSKIINNFKESIIYENIDFIIFNKWSGLASQGGSKVNFSINDIIKNISIDYNLVHRLDKDTSGLMIISKNLVTTKIFSKLFNEKKVQKIYLAICQGLPKKLNSIIKTQIQIEKDKNFYREAITKYNVINYNKNFSFITFQPYTGRKHQLRILSKSIGCPIVGDKKFNIDKKLKNEELKLNAYCLKFMINDKQYFFKSRLPFRFAEFLKKENFNFKSDQEFLEFF